MMITDPEQAFESAAELMRRAQRLRKEAKDFTIAELAELMIKVARGYEAEAWRLFALCESEVELPPVD